MKMIFVLCSYAMRYAPFAMLFFYKLDYLTVFV